MLSVLLHVGVYFANGGLACHFDVQDSAWVALHDWPLLVLVKVYTHTYIHTYIDMYMYKYIHTGVYFGHIVLPLLVTRPGNH